MPRSASPKYTVSSLAVAWEVDQATVSRWKAAGLPFGKDGTVRLSAATRWLREHERRERPRTTASDAAARRAAIEVELLELRLARERGDVVPAAEVLAVAEDEAVRVRGVLTQIPTEYAPVVAARCGCTIREASAVLRELADGVSARLAEPDEDDEP